MQMKLFNMIISILLALDIVAGPAAGNTTGNELIKKYIETSIVQEQIQESLTETPGLKWIDRIDWTGKEYGPQFYKSLESAVEDNGALIEVTKGLKDDRGYYIYITTIEGMTPTKEEATEQIKKDSSILGQYIGVVYKAFERDHPEVFWLSEKAMYKTNIWFDKTDAGYSYTVDVLFTLKTSNFDIRAPEYQDTEKIKQTIELQDKLVSSIIQASPSNNRYEQLKHFNSYLIEKNQYNTSADLYSLHRDCYTCISALRGSVGAEGPICEAYANAFKVLCDRTGIPCVLVNGYVSPSKSKESCHIWNYVQMEDKKWYAVDVTWNDVVSSQKISTDWFLVGSETKVKGVPFEKNHIISHERLGVVYEGGPELSKDAYQAQEE